MIGLMRIRMNFVVKARRYRQHLQCQEQKNSQNTGEGIATQRSTEPNWSSLFQAAAIK
jgi:hypothetical protein